jgi:hypothetical protein
VTVVGLHLRDAEQVGGAPGGRVAVQVRLDLGREGAYECFVPDRFDEAAAGELERFRGARIERSPGAHVRARHRADRAGPGEVRLEVVRCRHDLGEVLDVPHQPHPRRPSEASCPQVSRSWNTWSTPGVGSPSRSWTPMSP